MPAGVRGFTCWRLRPPAIRTWCFVLGINPMNVTIQSWSGFIGQWDDRQWKQTEVTIPTTRDAAGHSADIAAYLQRPRTRRDVYGEMIGITPGFIKRAPVAWYASHRHTPDGKNEAYAYSYLFAYTIDVPPDAKTLTLPNNDNVRIMAITGSNERTLTARPSRPVPTAPATEAPRTLVAYWNMTIRGTSVEIMLALKLSKISKSFGPTIALDGVDLELREGEVHALIGENGAGKSTLMNVIAGSLQPDQGTMEIDGKAYTPSNPLDARTHGIALIHQELSLCPHLSVAENVLMGIESSRLGWLDRDKLIARTNEVLKTFHHADIRPEKRVGDLSVAARQIVEISRAHCRRARIILMDEPTSSLQRDDVSHLFT